MAKLSKEEIQKVANLARIDLGEKEAETLTTEISSILEFVETIQSTDTKDIEATSQVTGLTDVWREDVVKDCTISQAELLKNAPQQQDGYVKVKKVL